jgi:hypothetical protein
MLKKGALMDAAAVVAGSVVGGVASAKLTMIADARLRNGLVFLAGVFISGQKNKMLSNVGTGMAAIGGAKLIGALVPALGISAIDTDEVVEGVYMEEDPINATVSPANMDVINGFNEDYSDND